MGTILSYSLAAGLYFAVAYGVYRILLAGACQARFNRAVLLSIYVVALTAPVVIPALSAIYSKLQPTEATGVFVGIPSLEAVTGPTATSKWLLAATVVYVVGLAVVILRSVTAIAGLIRITRRADREKREEYTLLIVDGCEVPFSFMRYIAIGRDDLGSEAGFILTHELAHIRLRHWVDLLVAQAVCCVMWYNPAAWLMRAELRRVHEYQADEAVMTSGLPVRPYQELLIKKAAGVRLQSIANSLNHSNISKRITMMYQKPSRRLRRLASLAMLPAVALTAVLIRQPAVASTLAAVSSADVAATAVSPEPEVIKIGDVTAVPVPYKGGLDALMSQLMKSVCYPKDAFEAGIQGKVVVSFTVTTEGKVADPKVVKSVHPSLDEEAVRAICALRDWTPALNEKGEPFDAQFSLPVNFKLSGKPTINFDELKVKPDVYIDGELYSGDLKEIDPNTIKEISVRKDDPAHPNGIMDITLKK